MHEYNITQNIINTVCKEAENNQATKVKVITLVIGDLSSIIDECVKMYFEVLSQGTICEQAQLEFKRIKAKLECRNCGEMFEKTNDFVCPFCEGFGKLTDIGKEFYIESIEVE